MKQHRRFRLDVTLSQPARGYVGRSGYVQSHIPEVVDALRPQRAYVCGLSAMVEATVAALKGSGMLPGSIRTELYDG